MAAAGFAALLVTAIAHTFNYDRSYHIPAEDVARTEAERTRQLAPSEGA
jgi:cytochrome o ubiquinol oxidase subunit 1